MGVTIGRHDVWEEPPAAGNGPDRWNARTDPPRRGVPPPAAAPSGHPGEGLPRQGNCRRDDGRLLAVWGPTGAPGRTTLAIGLAAELAQLGHRTLLVDADTYGPSVAQRLSLMNGSTGLGHALQEAARGTLDVARLRGLAEEALPGLRVLTGVPRPSRWPDTDLPGLRSLWPLTRRSAAWTVVDCGFHLETPAEATGGNGASRRGVATLSTLQEADLVLVVGQADPVGLTRLVRGLSELRALLPPDRPVQVVVNRLRPGAVGSAPERRVALALRRYAGVHDPILVPDDPVAHDRALLRALPLNQVAADSPARQALRSLTDRLTAGRPSEGRPPGPGTRCGSANRRGGRPAPQRARGRRRRWAGAGEARHELILRMVR